MSDDRIPMSAIVGLAALGLALGIVLAARLSVTSEDIWART